jgi:hypothetical protein
MPLPENIQQMAQALKDDVDALPPDEQALIFAALSIIRSVVQTFGESGQVALSIAAADFAAE